MCLLVAAGILSALNCWGNQVATIEKHFEMQRLKMSYKYQVLCYKS